LICLELKKRNFVLIFRGIMFASMMSNNSFKPTPLCGAA